MRTPIAISEKGILNQEPDRAPWQLHQTSPLHGNPGMHVPALLYSDVYGHESSGLFGDVRNRFEFMSDVCVTEDLGIDSYWPSSLPCIAC